ncbi:DUF5615 family PIN-like protein [Dyadobacter endophyticus]|uniref:DUF5615 family PIN-like protein n=1 Tax=Dyadobacter endophyticus TaxID=1749036 RepID=UPI003CF4062A
MRGLPSIPTYVTGNHLTIVIRDADFSIRISTSEPPPRIIHFHLGNIKASELFQLLYKNWYNITDHSKEYKLVTVFETE